MNKDIENKVKKFLPDNIRLARFYLRRLKHTFPHGKYGNTNQLSDYQEDIKNNLLSMNNDEMNIAMRSLIHDKECLFLNDSEFDWINTELKAAFVWGELHLPEQPTITLTTELEVKTQNKIISTIPSSFDDAKIKICKYFDDIKTFNKNSKHIISELKKSWDVFNGDFKKPLNWLSKDDIEECEWAWNFIREKINVYFELKPRTEYEYYICTLVTLIFGTNHVIDKKFTLSNMSKANSQRKFRKQVKDKVTLNTYIDKNSKKHLNAIAKSTGLNIQKTIEYLIDKEFNSLKKNT